MTAHSHATRRAILFLIAALIWPMARADSVEPPPMTIHPDATGMTIDNAGGPGVPLRVHLDGAGIVHVQIGATDAPASLVLDPQYTPAQTPVTHGEDARTARLVSQRLVASWDKAHAVLNVASADGRPLLAFHPLGAAQRTLSFAHAGNDSLYGIHGYSARENADAGLQRQGEHIARAGEQGHAGAPFVWSTSGYGVLVASDDNLTFRQALPTGGLARLDLVPPARSTPFAADFYILVGRPPELFGALAQLSGRAPLFPKWAMGFTNSQWGIDQKELLQIVDTYRAKHIPLDNITLDFDWKAWGEDDYGEFRWNATKFPDGPSGKLKAELDRRGVHLTGIMKPRVHLDTVEGRDATARDLWRPGQLAAADYFSHLPAKDIDFDKPAARAWFFNDALKHSFATGIAGWWNDEADNTPSNTQFTNMQRALYDGQRAISNQRVWSINRNFWLGAQRYAYGLWSGDIDTGFASMAGQRVRMLSAINVGAMQWGMDGGGFRGDMPSPENYARWVQFGAFTPIFRVHGDFGQKRKPWMYGPLAERAATEAIRLRQALIPYIYSYEHTRRTTGIGLVRPLLFDWPHDPALRNDVDAWLFGDWLLASPVVVEGQTTKHIYLPAGRWTDWFSGTTYAGGQAITLAIDSKHWSDIPLFVRDGAIIPTQPPMDYVGEQPLTQLDVDVFPADRRTQFDYYDDDGGSYDYEHGAYFNQSLAVQRRGDTVRVEVGKVSGSFRPALKFYLLKIHGAAANRVSGGLTFLDGLDALQRSGGEGWARGRDRYGAVTWLRVAAARSADITLDL
jgi:alpha-glucosidase (family GH31 glycosyl hydrolase)